MKKNPLTKEFYELFALQILQNYYPTKYTGLRKSESPDFFNSEVGLEVTRAIEESAREIDGVFNTFLYRSFNDIPPQQLVKLGFYDKPIPAHNEGVLFVQRSLQKGTLWYYLDTNSNDLKLLMQISRFSQENSLCDSIVEAIVKKTKKLNNNYRSTTAKRIATPFQVRPSM